MMVKGMMMGMMMMTMTMAMATTPMTTIMMMIEEVEGQNEDDGFSIDKWYENTNAYLYIQHANG